MSLQRSILLLTPWLLAALSPPKASFVFQLTPPQSGASPLWSLFNCFFSKPILVHRGPPWFASVRFFFFLLFSPPVHPPSLFNPADLFPPVTCFPSLDQFLSVAPPSFPFCAPISTDYGRGHPPVIIDPPLPSFEENVSAILQRPSMAGGRPFSVFSSWFTFAGQPLD